MAFVRYGRTLLCARQLYNPIRQQHGFVVLLPEIGEENPEKNPLYQSDGLPKFNQITIENCRAAMAKQALDFEVGVQDIEKQIDDGICEDAITSIIEPLETLGHPLETTWGLSKTLYLGNNTLMPTSTYTAIHERARRARAAKYTSKKIHSAIKQDISTEKQRSAEQQRVLQKFALEGKLNGLELSEEDHQKFNYDYNKLIQEKKPYKVKIEFGLRQHSQLITDRTIVRDFPEDLLKATAVDPNFHMNGPWKFTLAPHVFTPLMEHCPSREIRWALWRADVIRGSTAGDREYSTSLHVEEMRFLKNKLAKLLGYKTYVDMSMETKMAGSKAEVDRVLHLLLERAKPAQDEELQNLLEFVNERGFKTDTLELWDIPYWRRKRRRALYNYDEAQLKNYFPLNTVLSGMFQLCEKLFNIVIKTRTGVTAWHKDVRFYDIFEAHSSAPVAGFYLDPYARSEDKLRISNSGWMVAMQNKSQLTEAKPLAALIFNFESPQGEMESHLTFPEVKVLFQKFGHALQHLLTRTFYSEVAGLSNVEWDAVGISGNMLSHWLFNEEVMNSISCYCGTGDKLPKPVFDNLCLAQTHMAGLDLSTELYLSALDLELHSSKEFWLDIVKKLWPQYRSFKYDQKVDAHPCHFSQIISDEWGAAYYSHIWSRMIAADVYSAFYEVKDDPQQIKDVGKRYRDTFLALGGSQHSGKIFREFRGRDPSHKALLKTLGLKKSKESQ
ncbi:uncharacterized protein LOC126750647 [Anthonomus grandis grandis]|uniref:uncharacterized protein LOC126750647 n=1 Tax=Anthonomus grandis grandis TaxID=2921223 RepID=UPI002165AC53|nr:uncharacterized protein LOC126750647 [Anthonomus grandis grandis]